MKRYLFFFFKIMAVLLTLEKKKEAWVYGPRLAGPRAWACLCGPSTRPGLPGP